MKRVGSFGHEGFLGPRVGDRACGSVAEGTCRMERLFGSAFTGNFISRSYAGLEGYVPLALAYLVLTLPPSRPTAAGTDSSFNSSPGDITRRSV